MLPVRVYFEDTDFSGLVYHGSYVRWCERGRSDFLRLLGGDHRRLIDGSGGAEPAAFVVRRMALEFLKPARIDEVLEVVTRVKAVGAASLTLAQSVRRGGDDDCRSRGDGRSDLGLGQAAAHIGHAARSLRRDLAGRGARAVSPRPPVHRHAKNA